MQIKESQGTQLSMQPGQGTQVINDGSSQENDNLNMVYPTNVPEREMMKSGVLVIASYWHARYPARKVTELLEKSFTQDDMYNAMVRVSNILSMNKVTKHRNMVRRSGEEGQAQAMYQLLEEMDTENRTPLFVVGIEEMELMQRAMTNLSLASGENVQIGARLESLEVGLMDLGENIGKIYVPVNVSTTIPVKKVNETPSIIVSDLSQSTFAKMLLEE